MLNALPQLNFAQQVKPSKVAYLPKFGHTLPTYSQPVDVSFVRTSDRKPFGAPVEKNTVVINLVPKTNQHLSQLAQAVGDAKDNLVQVLLDALPVSPQQAAEDSFSPPTLGSTTETVAYFDIAESGSLQTEGKSKKEIAEAKSSASKSVGAQNTKALLNAFTDKLNALDDKTTDVTVALPKPLPKGVDETSLVRRMATLATQRGYNYNLYRSDKRIQQALANVVLNRNVASTGQNAALKEGVAIGEGMLLTRHMVDSTDETCTPGYMANVATELDKQYTTLTTTVLERPDLEGQTALNDKRMGLHLAVAQGNGSQDTNQPRVIEMVHTPDDWDPKTGKTIVLVGKGITFDTGGYDFKGSVHADHMHGDMAGAGAVIGTMKALSESPVGNVRVIGVAGCTPNLLGSEAQRKHSYQVARSGKTVEVNNTDAEGRLVLADAVNWVMEKYGADVDALFTAATLTGAKVAAVGGPNAVGVVSNNADFMNAVNDQILNGQLGRKTKTVHLDEKHHKMVSRNGKGRTDLINASGREEKIAAQIVDLNDMLENPTSKKPENETQYLRDSFLSGMADGAVFVQAAGMEKASKVDADGNILAYEQYDVPWAHFDIAGAEFAPSTPKVSGGQRWASGIGVEDMYMSIKAIGEGDIKPDPKKTTLMDKS